VFVLPQCTLMSSSSGRVPWRSFWDSDSNRAVHPPSFQWLCPSRVHCPRMRRALFNPYLSSRVIAR